MRFTDLFDKFTLGEKSGHRINLDTTSIFQLEKECRRICASFVGQPVTKSLEKYITSIMARCLVDFGNDLGIHIEPDSLGLHLANGNMLTFRLHPRILNRLLEHPLWIAAKEKRVAAQLVSGKGLIASLGHRNIDWAPKFEHQPQDIKGDCKDCSKVITIYSVGESFEVFVYDRNSSNDAYLFHTITEDNLDYSINIMAVDPRALCDKIRSML